MPSFRIHRIKDAPSESFRWAAHTGGLAVVKLKDYEGNGEVEAQTPYAAWKRLAADGRALRPGDVLEMQGSTQPQLYIYKYIGFEPAQWFVPEPNPDASSAPESVGTSSSCSP